MPIYEFECNDCHKRFEKIQKMKDPFPPCPSCGGAVHKCFSVCALMFKGSGFYINDYKKKGSGASSEVSSNKGTKSEVASSKEVK